MYRLVKNNLELIFWITALTSLAFTDPTQTHFVLCPLRLMGFTWCPGCGLGHAIAFLFHGEINASWHAHWFGVPALLILFYRIGTLLNQAIKATKPVEENAPFSPTANRRLPI